VFRLVCGGSLVAYSLCGETQKVGNELFKGEVRNDAAVKLCRWAWASHDTPGAGSMAVGSHQICLVSTLAGHLARVLPSEWSRGHTLTAMP
jgi:hypothetical protein